MAKENVAGKLFWRRLLIKELLILGVIFAILATLWHPDLLHSPLDRLDRLGQTALVSPWHPFFWTLGIYSFSGMIRLLLALVKKLQRN